MSRITHFKHQPKSVYYWDYYILCQLNVAAAIAIQRMEYWDGTKDAAIPQAEALNDAQVANNKPATQDTSHWVYKAQDELQWELMGITGEKGVAALTKFLEEDLHYLESRHNPHLGFDRKKQYAFQAKLIQEHIHYLAYLIGFFEEMDIRLTPVHYAIELLTKEGVFIEELSIEHILNKLREMYTISKLPTFIKQELAEEKHILNLITAEGETKRETELLSQLPPSSEEVARKAYEIKIAREKQRVEYHCKRARKAGLSATLTRDQWLETLDYFHWNCAYCKTGKYDLLEHFIPIIHGGGTEQANCIPACRSCNTLKLSWHPLKPWGPTMSSIKDEVERIQYSFLQLGKGEGR